MTVFLSSVNLRVSFCDRICSSLFCRLPSIYVACPSWPRNRALIWFPFALRAPPHTYFLFFNDESVSIFSEIILRTTKEFKSPRFSLPVASGPPAPFKPHSSLKRDGPFERAASVIAVLQIASSVLAACYRYQDSARHAKSDISRLVDELESFRDILKNVKKITDEEESGGKRLETVQESTRKTLDQCHKELAELDEKLAPKDGWRAIGQKLSWPLKADEVLKIHGDLERFKSTLSLALTTGVT
ncbi:hypothetical protein MMC17_007901 [Xylographa soralifera]|nr:hypothetical protein [Xylographa soralifera]